MLLFQWGTCDWGEGEAFEIDVTRQVIEDHAEEEPQQLKLTFRFEPTEELKALGAGNRWCSGPDGLSNFRHFIAGSPPFQATAHQQPKEVVLRLGQV